MNSYEAAKEDSQLVLDNLSSREDECPYCAVLRQEIFDVDEVISSTRIESSDEFARRFETKPGDTIFKVPNVPISTKVRSASGRIGVTPIAQKALIRVVLEKSSQTIAQSKDVERIQESEMVFCREVYTDPDFHELVSFDPARLVETTTDLALKRDEDKAGLEMVLDELCNRRKPLLRVVLEKSLLDQTTSAAQNEEMGRIQESVMGPGAYTDFDFHEFMSSTPARMVATTADHPLKRKRDEGEAIPNELCEQVAKKARLADLPVFFKGRRPSARKTIRV